MRDQGLGSWPRRRARMTPSKAALVQDGTPMSYGDLDRAVTRLAHGLRARGVERGDRVAFLGLNSIEMVVTLLATARLGSVSVPVNTRLAAPELAHVLDHSGSRLLVVEDVFADALEAPAGRRARTGVRALHPRRRRRSRAPRGRRPHRDRRADRARRPVHDPVHLRHERAAEGRDADPRQRGVERRQPDGRRRPQQRRGRPRDRPVVPHRRPEPGAVPDHPQGRYGVDRGPLRRRASSGAHRVARRHAALRRDLDVPRDRRRAHASPKPTSAACGWR